jgi:chemotaxis protein methyltransferase CheR
MIAEIKDLSRKDYELFRKLVYEKCGINLGEHKMQLVRARLGKRVRKGGFKSFRDYYEHVASDSSGEELTSLLDSISTNTTHLFREIRHFNLLHKIILEMVEDRTWRIHNNCIRIWSAACSSGEEPHSIAMVAYNALRNYRGIEVKILATDISTRMLSKAQLGFYEPHRVGTVPQNLKNLCLEQTKVNGDTILQVIPPVRRLITFARFNLMTPTFPFRYGFDVVFCRNVMIYFDRPTQQALTDKISNQLHQGGHLLIGHSESLNNIQHNLKYIEPTVYQKI